MVRRVVGLAASVLLVLALAAPAGATDGSSYYLALGDSVAAAYQPNGAPVRQGYVSQVHRALSVEDHLVLRNLACSGATTTSMSDGPGCVTPEPQLAAAERFLRTYGSRVRLVTVDIGANDVNQCVGNGTVDQACLAVTMGTVRDGLSRIIQRLRVVAPQVQIVGMTYYNPHAAAWLRGPAGQAFAQQSVPLAVMLNRILTEAYAAGGVRVADVAGAYAITDLTFPAPLPAGGEAPLAVARICAWTWMCPAPGGRPDIHPNAAGHQVIADAFLAVIR